MKIQILISKNSWAEKYKDIIKKKLSRFSSNIYIFGNHRNLKANFDINIIFSYYKIINEKFLKRSKFNLIPHESKLPAGRGMSPLSWQILQGRKKIIFSLIEATKKIDAGNIYYQKEISFNDALIFSEIKDLQFNSNLKLIIKFLKYYKIKNKSPRNIQQKGKASYFKLRTPKDSELNINKSLKSQFNLMRLCEYNHYPAYFYIKKKKYIIKLDKHKK